MKVTIVGAGNMGRAIGTRAVAGGHEVEIIANDPSHARHPDLGQPGHPGRHLLGRGGRRARR